MKKNNKVLITGVAGFIGFSTAKKMLERGNAVYGLDILNNYYDPKLKRNRLNILKKFKRFTFKKIDISNKKKLTDVFSRNKFKSVINLAAQAGVRYSLENPEIYIKSNVVGFSNLIECSKNYKIKHFVYASTSSVYGLNTKQPLSEVDGVNHPMQIYAASKRANELIAHSYSHLFKLPTTGLRFFTVYGPWGRPDMSLFLFTKNILNRKPINVFNRGDHIRDFTYIDDVVDGILKANDRIFKKNRIKSAPSFNAGSGIAPFEIFNIGNSKPIKLMKFIDLIEKKLNLTAKIKFLPMQKGDIKQTFANINKAKKILKFKPKTSTKKGVSNFVDWYLEYFKINKK